MMYVEAQYFSLNKSLLLILGLWPYQQSKAVQLQSLIYLWILTTAIIFQFTSFLTSKCTANFIMKVLANAVAFTIFLTKYVLFRMHMESMKDLLMQLQHVYNELKEESEIAIIEKYSCNAKRHTFVLTIFGIFCISVVSIILLWPNILADFVPSKNESCSRQIQIAMEYFLDQERYFYLIVLHLIAAIFIGLISLLAIGTMFIAYFQHICGMFTIAKCRIEHAIETYIQDTNLKNEHSTLKRLICAIVIHRQAMQLCDVLICKFETLFLLLIVLGVACLSLNLLRIASTENDIMDFMFPVMFTIISILYMFLANYVGQNITDHNDYVYAVAYNSKWYRVPVYIQKVILFLLQRGIKSFTLSIGGLFDASFECFATLVKASVSYFTVIYSTR